MEQDQVNVLLIGGIGRSGSTLLHRIVGSHNGYLPIGELNNSWEFCFLRNDPCSCGRPFNECEFWRAVVDCAFGGIDSVDVKYIRSLYQATQGKLKASLLLSAPGLRTEIFQRQLREYANILETIYHAIKKVSGCDVIVDCSKSPHHAFAVSEISSVRLRMIHLVRDSRAVTHSWSRIKRRTDVPNNDAYMQRYSSFQSATRWSKTQTLISLAARRTSRSTVCRYEDFVSQPRDTIECLLNQLGLEYGPESPFVSNDSVRLGDDHCLWGNPNRVDRGVITIKPDNEWEQRMPSLDKLLVTMLTLPWMVKYGYVPIGRARSI